MIIPDAWTARVQQSFIVAELLAAAVEQFHQVTQMTIAETRMILANDHCGVRASWSVSTIYAMQCIPCE